MGSDALYATPDTHPYQIGDQTTKILSGESTVDKNYFPIVIYRDSPREDPTLHQTLPLSKIKGNDKKKWAEFLMHGIQDTTDEL